MRPRWGIEQAFFDARNVLGAGQARNRVRAAVERTVPFALLVHTLVIVWYARHGYDRVGIADRRAAEPWYAAKDEPAFADLLTKLRRTMITARISGGSPAHPNPNKSKQSWQPGTPPPHNCETPDIAQSRRFRSRTH